MGLLRRIEGSAPNPAPSLPAAGATAPAAGEDQTYVRRPAAGNEPARSASRDLKGRVQAKVIAELDPKSDLTNEVQVRQSIQLLFDQVIEQEGTVMTRLERQKLFEEVYAEIRGLGPIEPLLQDPVVSEVMVNGPKQVYIEQAGKLKRTDVAFDDDDHVMRIIDRIVSPLGRHVDESSPMVDARLPDGSRVNIIIPPLSLRVRSSPSASSPRARSPWTI